MNTLALIPARGGSKRLPRKNLAKVGPHSLVGWAVLHARESGVCDRIVVSTDDPEISREAEKYEAEVIIRPADLCNDSALLDGVVRHALAHEPMNGRNADAVLVLQPTSPLRTAEDVRACLGLLGEPDGAATATVNMHPAHVPSEWSNEYGYTKYHPYNGGVYAMLTEAFARGMHIGDMDNAVTVPVPWWRSVDVDTEAELEAARVLYEAMVTGRLK